MYDVRLGKPSTVRVDKDATESSLDVKDYGRHARSRKELQHNPKKNVLLFDFESFPNRHYRAVHRGNELSGARRGEYYYSQDP